MIFCIVAGCIYLVFYAGKTVADIAYSSGYNDGVANTIAHYEWKIVHEYVRFDVVEQAEEPVIHYPNYPDNKPSDPEKPPKK